MSLRSLLQAWLRRTIQPSGAPQIVEASFPPCHVGVVYAMALEAAALEERLSGLIAIRGAQFEARQGGLRGRGIVVVRSGVGRDSAARAAEALIAGHRPRWVVSAGLAAGLDPELKRGDIVVPDAVVGEEGSRVAIELPMAREAMCQSQRVFGGTLLTVDRVVLKAVAKRELGQRHGAVCVDMETLGVTEVCRQHQQPFFAVRIVSDAVDEDLPPDVERLVQKSTLARRLGAAAGSILRRPGMVKDLWRLKETALVCSDQLARFLEEVIGKVEVRSQKPEDRRRLDEPAG